MKKITTAIVILLGTISMASADLGINIGIAGNTSIWHATGVEEHTANSTSQTEDAVGVSGYDSYFIEKTLGKRITIGFEHSTEALTTDTAENNRYSLDSGNQSTTKTNTVQLKFENLDMLYVHLNISPSVYVKFGETQVDVITNESLGTGSSYDNFSLDGSLVGAGYNKSFSNGIFLRGEANFLEFDDSAKKTSLDNTVQMKGLEGGQFKIALGYSF